MLLEINTRNYKLISIILIVILILGVFIYNIIRYGSGGIGIAISKTLWMIVILSFVALVIAIIWILFFYEKKIDVNYEVAKNLEEETKINNPKNMIDLWLKGDINHKPVKIGKIIGWSPTTSYKIIKNARGEITDVQTREPMSAFNVRTNIFKSWRVVCPIDLHDTLNGDVYIKATGLNKHLDYLYPNNCELDFEKIDETIYYKGVRFVNLKKISLIDDLVNKAMGVSKLDVEDLKGKKGIEVAKEVTK
jgi:hypothetical protein